MKKGIFSKKMIFALTVGVAFATGILFNISTSMNNTETDITLQAIEVKAQTEGSDHGRPLLQRVSDGAYFCQNCSGNDAELLAYKSYQLRCIIQKN